MNPLEAAILRTILYADVFSFPLNLQEIHHFLIHDKPVDLADVQACLESSTYLETRLACVQSFYICHDRTELVAVRLQREAAADYLWPIALHYGRWLARLPFVRMVALTGALAVRNVTDKDDDLDYLIITQPGRVWIARAFAILLVRYGRLRGVEVCPNYVLAADKLEQTRQDIFMAHEIAQMVPLYGLPLYVALRDANAWVDAHLPNASGAFQAAVDMTTSDRGWLKRLLELLLGGRAGAALERWEYQRKLRRFQVELQTPHSSAQIDATQVKGHFNDNGHPTLQKYQRRLQEYGLAEDLQKLVAGD